jgi:hypothetical protein
VPIFVAALELPVVRTTALASFAVVTLVVLYTRHRRPRWMA